MSAPSDPSEPSKQQLRALIEQARRSMPAADREKATRRICEAALAVPAIGSAATVAAYLGIAAEPGTARLLEELVRAGKRVLLPVLRPDLDLDWAAYDGPRSLRPRPRGLREPAGPLLGVEAICTAEAVLLPGLAVDEAGTRLGRGGGSYDRALSRVGHGRFTAVLLYDGEVLAAIPREPHDRPVSAAVLPRGVRLFG